MKSRAPEAPGRCCSAGERLLQNRYRELIQKHLSHVLDRLFAEFTGLHFQIAWAPACPKSWEDIGLPTGCSVCCELSGSPRLPECRTCGPRHLAAALESDHGHRFTCRLGVRNYWFRIKVRRETLGIAHLQALEHAPRRRRNTSALTAVRRCRRAKPMVLNRVKFARAARFLQHIVQHVQTASLSELLKADLSSAARAVLALEREQTRLHATLQRYLPAAAQRPRSSGPKSHTYQIVHGLLERVELDYAKPITLRQLARELGMNAAYLSALFSHAVGVPFKTYLTELRLQKSQELLSDYARTTSEVAFAVGYSSEERFRCAFKKATGLSPRIWRETMQTHPADHSS